MAILHVDPGLTAASIHPSTHPGQELDLAPSHVIDRTGMIILNFTEGSERLSKACKITQLANDEDRFERRQSDPRALTIAAITH